MENMSILLEFSRVPDACYTGSISF